MVLKLTIELGIISKYVWSFDSASISWSNCFGKPCSQKPLTDIQRYNSFSYTRHIIVVGVIANIRSNYTRIVKCLCFPRGRLRSQVYCSAHTFIMNTIVPGLIREIECCQKATWQLFTPQCFTCSISKLSWDDVFIFQWHNPGCKIHSVHSPRRDQITPRPPKIGKKVLYSKEIYITVPIRVLVPI